VLVLGASLVVLGVVFIVLNRQYVRWWLGTYADRVGPRDVLWLRLGAIGSGILIAATGVILIFNGGR